MTVETAPDGGPMVGPFDRAGWRAWLIANHATSDGVYLVSFRRGSGQVSVPYEEAVEEALCVGWIDSVGRVLDDERAIQRFSPRRAGSGWARSNKGRIGRLAAAGLMLPAGLAAIEAAKRDGSWTKLDDVENHVVPADLGSALDAAPPARERWDAFSRSARRMMLVWLVDAKRPETRAKRIAEIASHAAQGEQPPAFRRRA
ncbi:MAG: YdeI/OmpD-associated family protein [Candidatus Limnocylindrales bacterium]